MKAPRRNRRSPGRVFPPLNTRVAYRNLYDADRRDPLGDLLGAAFIAEARHPARQEVRS